MAKNETKRIKPSILADDIEVYAALKDIPDYAPANPAYTLAAMDAVHQRLIAAREASTQADARAEAARDDLVAAQWDMHNMTLGAKDQVQAQFGPNSNEIQSMKRKKKTERRNPVSKIKLAQS
ncbi:MAG TPA: hypothetical protein VGC64_00625 [Pyrinomonadaceae bacterium]